MIYRFFAACMLLVFSFTTEIGGTGEPANDLQVTTDLYAPNMPVDEKPLPDGVREGITYLDAHSVILTLFAPHKNSVYVIGDFNNWQATSSYSMHRHTVDADSVYWWLQIDQLLAGQEYAFQYLVDGNLRIADPYTEKVLDPWDDQYISDETYPGLRSYPAGRTTEPVSVFRTNQAAFTWKYSDTFEAPSQEQLVIYELLVRDFTREHDYKTLIDTLTYFEKLGINAIELMPVVEFEGNLSWGYNPSFYFAPDKYYGPAEDLKKFIDACHQKGIAVIMDMVLNHSYGQSPLVRLYYDTRNNRPSAQNPWYNVQSPNTDYAWGYDFNHTSPATQKFVDRVIKHWLQNYKIDGFRFDFTKGFTNTTGDGWAYDAQRIAILERIADIIWTINPEAYVILEHFTDNREEKELAAYKHGMMIWGNMNYNYNEATMGYHEDGKSNFSWGYFDNRGWSMANLVTYMESHDEERLMYKNLQYGNSYGSYNIKQLPTALDRIKLAASFFLTYPGPKMIWQFGEVGYDYTIDYNGRTGEKPIRWDYYGDDDLRKELFDAFAAMIKLRINNAAFYSAESQVIMDVSGPIKRIRLIHPRMQAVIIGNFDVVNFRMNPQFPDEYTWYDYLSGDSLTSIPESVLLQPGEFHIYTDIKIDKSSGGKPNGTPQGYYLTQNFPNPFNSETCIRYQLPARTSVKLEIYTITGQRVATLIDGEQPAGSYPIVWRGVTDQGVPVASGIYIYRLNCRQFTKSNKMILVR